VLVIGKKKAAIQEVEGVEYPCTQENDLQECSQELSQ